MLYVDFPHRTKPVSSNQVKIIAITDAPIASLNDAHELPRREIGEIIVSGPTVTKRYDAVPEATAAAKISDRQPGAVTTVWHRMGDCGYVDDDGRIWFCGRKVERVETGSGTLFTEPCEQVFRTHPNVARCALIGLGVRGQKQPALVIESTGPQRKDLAEFARELRVLAKGSPVTGAITRFYFHRKLPVDVRHNAKIHRLTLARWATQARVYEVAS